MYRIGFVDEDRMEVKRFEREFRDSEEYNEFFELVGYEIEEGTSKENLLEQIYRSDIDLLMVDFLMTDKGILAYNGDEIVREFEKLKPKFPTLIFTSNVDDAFPDVDDVNTIYDKSTASEKKKHFADILTKNIELYKKYVAEREFKIRSLLEKRDASGLDAIEKHNLLEAQIELINLDKRSNEVPLQQLVDEARRNELVQTAKEAEALLKEFLSK